MDKKLYATETEANKAAEALGCKARRSWIPWERGGWYLVRLDRSSGEWVLVEPL